MQAVLDQFLSERKSGQAHRNDPCWPCEVRMSTLQQIFHKEVQLAGPPEKRCIETSKLA